MDKRSMDPWAKLYIHPLNLSILWLNSFDDATYSRYIIDEQHKKETFGKECKVLNIFKLIYLSTQ